VDLSAYPAVLKVGEVVEITRLSRSGVYSLLDSGQLVHVRLNGSIRVPRTAVESLLRKGLRGG
jgi:excisionase family DNA binding protein